MSAESANTAILIQTAFGNNDKKSNENTYAQPKI